MSKATEGQVFALSVSKVEGREVRLLVPQPWVQRDVCACPHRPCRLFSREWHPHMCFNVQLLIGHITTSILKYVGGEGKGEELVGAYMKKFGKMHS